MKFNRRQLLLNTGGLGLAALGLSFYSKINSSLDKDPYSPMGFIYGFGRELNQPKKKYFLTIADLNQSSKIINKIPMSFFGHGIAFHPYKKNIITVFEKKGSSACEIDIVTGEQRSFEPIPGSYFYGHGVYFFDRSGNSNDLHSVQANSKTSLGQLKILSTETFLTTAEGVISVRDAETLKLEGTFPSYGLHPHDCILTENGKVIAVTNGNSKSRPYVRSSITYIDLKTQKLLDKFEVEDSKYEVGHLAISKNKDLVAVTKPGVALPDTDNGSITLVSTENKKLVSLSQPKKIIDQLIGETLSVFIDDDRGIFAATSPLGNIVTFWSLKTGEFLSSTKLSNPRGVTLSKDKKYFIISYHSNSNLAFVNAETFLLDKSLTIRKAGFSGSHLYKV